MPDDRALREQLIQLVRGGHAHATFDQAVRDFPPDRMGVRPPGAQHSSWELLEHMRLAQNDILRFSQSAAWVSPEFPGGYWPKAPAPGKPGDWSDSVRAFHRDLAEFEALVRDRSRLLRNPFDTPTALATLASDFPHRRRSLRNWGPMEHCPSTELAARCWSNPSCFS